MDASEAAAFVVPRQDRDVDESASGAVPSVAVACPSLEAAGALIRRPGIKAEVIKSEIRDDDGDNLAEPCKKLDPDDARSMSQSLRKCEMPMAEGVHLEVIKEFRTACINKFVATVGLTGFVRTIDKDADAYVRFDESIAPWSEESKHNVIAFCGTKQLQTTVSVTEACLAQGQEVQATTTVDISKVLRALSGLTPGAEVL